MGMLSGIPVRRLNRSATHPKNLTRTDTLLRPPFERPRKGGFGGGLSKGATGFEPARAYNPAELETAALDHSATHPPQDLEAMGYDPMTSRLQGERSTPELSPLFPAPPPLTGKSLKQGPAPFFWVSAPPREIESLSLPRKGNVLPLDDGGVLPTP